MQAIDVVCFNIIVGGSILIIETVFAGSNKMTAFMWVSLLNVLLSSRTILSFKISQCTTLYTYISSAIANSLIHRNKRSRELRRCF